MLLIKKPDNARMLRVILLTALAVNIVLVTSTEEGADTETNSQISDKSSYNYTAESSASSTFERSSSNSDSQESKSYISDSDKSKGFAKSYAFSKSHSTNEKSSAHASSIRSSSVVISNHNKKNVCGVHERWVDCPESLCLPKYCTDLGFPIATCAGKDEKGTCSCKPGCICIEGYVKDDYEKCIEARKCPSCGGDENAQHGCEKNCKRLCSNWNSTEEISCILPCDLNGCICKDGYVLDENINKCVKTKDCTPTCNAYEIFDSCVNGGCYTARTCEDLDTLGGNSICVDPEKCEPGCLCKKGYVRDANGKCIPKNACPRKCRKPFEIYVKCPDTQCAAQTCDQLGFQEKIKCATPGPNGECLGKPKCLCRPGYLRDRHGDCIPQDECPSCGGDRNATLGCGVNCGRLCSNYFKRNQACALYCKLNSCDCKKGYVYDEERKQCVLPKDCSRVCGKNEEFSTCSNNGCYGVQKCSEIRNGKKVPPKCVNLRPEACVPDCVCKKGFLRNEKGVCVPIKQCEGNTPTPAPCPVGQTLVCDTNCNRKCTDLLNGLSSTCPMIQCVTTSCLCDPNQGYWLDDTQMTNKCVPAANCTAPESIKCKKPFETFVKCPDTVCAAQTCEQLGFPEKIKCVPGPNGECPGKPKCLCLPGYLRDCKGNCIPQDRCPSCGGDRNATSGCGINCGRLCTNYFKRNQVCALICKLNACDCKKGYVYDQDRKQCVHPKDCSRVCGRNEELSTCSNGGCYGARKCSDIQNGTDVPIKCVKLKPEACVTDCVCKKDFLRNKAGVCVPKEECEGVVKCKKPFETYVKCPDTVCAAQTCDQLGFPEKIKCASPGPNDECPGKPKCLCLPGYLRDCKGNCIPQDQCRCGINCGRLCTNYFKPNAICPKICKLNSCDCKKGYVYDQDRKQCVHPEDCSRVCGQNEELSTCSNGGCYGARKCSDIQNGTDVPIKCVKLKPGACITDCVCKEGFLRNETGDCVPKEECGGNVPTCNADDNEVFDSCANGGCYTARTCKDLDTLGGNTICVDPLKCEPGCLCKIDYVRDSSGKCIPQYTCPNSKCKKPFETYVECPDTQCAAQTCDQLDFQEKIKCATPGPNGECPGKPKCLCRPGYLRDCNGDCIPQDQCPSCGGDKNATSGCGNCGRLCSNYFKPITVCPKLLCRRDSCMCKTGYVYDEDRKQCVHPEDCSRVCGQNEELSTCSNGGCYGAKTCSEIQNSTDVPIKCVKLKPEACITDCVCKEGFLRNETGNCVPKEECGDMFKHGRGQDFDHWGGRQEINNNIHAAETSTNGQTACQREDLCPAVGYFRPLGSRVPTCNADDNEVFDSCANGGCYTARTCTDLDTLDGNTICVDPLKCEPGCLCKEDYVRDSTGKCIPLYTCPNSKCKKPFETHVKCPEAQCAAQTCDQLIFQEDIQCTTLEPNGECLGQPKCLCYPGYLRDSNGDCIPQDQCPPICNADDNEVFDSCANGGCYTARTCKDLDTLGGNTICADPLKCEPGCLCKEDYVRDSTGKCIPLYTCPNNKCKKPFETYVECPDTQCAAQTCDQLGFQEKIQCATSGPNDECPGKPKCLCRPGYLRDCNGNCIPQNQCPSCGGDKNATSGCGINCGRLCTNYFKPNQICPFICLVNSCDCKPGYVYDEDRKQCVNSKDCSRVCGRNEELSTCSNGGCYGAKKCSEIQNGTDVPIKCVKLKPDACVTDCVCKEGFLRNETGDCVSKEECGVPTCNADDNEVFDSCANGGCYTARTCTDLDTLDGNTICVDPLKCAPGCLCKEDYVRDSTGKCIPLYTCPNSKCKKPFETYVKCPDAQCAAQTCDQLIFQEDIQCTTLEPNGECLGQPKCLCYPGYLRDSNGDCIPQDQCPPVCNADDNEVFDSCANGGCYTARTCKDLDTFGGNTICEDPIKCAPGCLCLEGYVRDSTGKCILQHTCPNSKCKKPFETYVECPDTQCAAQTCDQLGFQEKIKCATPGPNGECPGEPKCLCGPGYLRDCNGDCIPQNQCPSCGGDKNATSGCGTNCGRLCTNYFKPNQICPFICFVNSCDCKPGYVYDEDRKQCVDSKDCSRVCGENEEFNPCANGGCSGPQKCSEIQNGTKVLIKCVKLKPEDCIPDCVCKKGFLRNEKGVCVAREECEGNGQCGENEEYNLCPSTCPGERCGVDIRLILCSRPPSVGDPDCLPAACVCKPGFFRDENGKCVPFEQCTKCSKNEEYCLCLSSCPPRECGINDAAVLCAPVDESTCAPGCRCKDGFVRNKYGNCVAPKDCPLPPTNQTCKANQVFDLCPRKCPPRVCGIDDRLIDCTPQPQPGDPNCPEPACRCKNGFYENNKKECVPWEDCPTCGENQVYDPCIAPCPPGICGIDDSVIRCAAPPQLGDPECVAGCRCADGFVKTLDGHCVTRDQCPTESQCGKNEVYDLCLTSCPPRVCGINDAAVQCARVDESTCTPGCRCQDGFVRNSDGDCVAPEECPLPPTCGENQVYDPCIAPCPPRRCGVDDRLIDCVAPPQLGDPNCVAGCRCADGFVINSNGECVTRDQCPSEPKCTKENEIFACGSACDNVCSNLSQQNQTNCPIKNKRCVSQCYCKPGYARDSFGNCVPIHECRNCTGDHEWYDICPQECPPETCPVLGAIYNCPLTLIPLKCNPSCRCEDNYRRDATGVCIPIKKCPCGDDPNAIYGSGCGVSCDRLCSTYNSTKPIACATICYTDRCDCKFGFVYDEHKKLCVLPKDCTPTVKCFKSNEMWVACPNPSDVNTCDSIKKKFNCTLHFSRNKRLCVGECKCKPGYWRNAIGDCVTKGECLQCKKQNEYFACGGACDNVCSNLSHQNQTNCPIINIKCNPMCYCAPGYARDSFGECIPIHECRNCTGEHEYYDKCPRYCQPDTCPIPGVVYDCPREPDPPMCFPSCRCEDNYARNPEGKCVLKKNCPCGDDPNAVYGSGCGVSCDRLCSTYNSTEPILCPDVCYTDQCDCKIGFVYDEIKKLCVLPKHCTSPGRCSKNEVYDRCLSSCPLRVCGINDAAVLCPPVDESTCAPGCRCKDGFVRNKYGNCVTPEECDPLPPQVCGQNEEISTCSNGECRPQKCSEIQNGADVPILCVKLKPEDCIIDCICKKGFLRNKKSVCVPKEECGGNVQCKKRNEYFSCGGACDNVCSNLGQQNQTNCPKINVKCNPMCYCKPGYARDSFGECIPIAECRNCTGDHEYFDKCPRNCPPETCPVPGAGYDCPQESDPPKCNPSCRCEDNYARNSEGDCVPVRDCPCGNDPNAEYGSGCGVSCDRLCSTYNSTKPIACPDICYTDRCDCKIGFVYDEIKKLCVLPKYCSPPECKNGGTWNTCPPQKCKAEYCAKSRDAPSSCISPKNCGIPRCTCGFNQKRDSNGKCINIRDCPPFECGVNEVYNACPSICGDKCTDRNSTCGNSRFRIGIVIPCTPKCVCKKNYFRNSQGLCVKSSQCDEAPKCNINEEYSNCTQAICRQQECSKKGEPLACPCTEEKDCLKGCVCKESFFRDANGNCIPEDQCPAMQCLKPNEIWMACPKPCDPNTCESIGKKFYCPIQRKRRCKGECRCKPGYWRNAIGECITKEECLKCNKKNEYFSCGGACDNVCSNLGQQNQTNCPYINIKCNPMCYCKSGYARDSFGECIPISECRNCTGDHEYYDKCPRNCPPETCPVPGAGYDCPQESDPPKCNPSCRCEDNYARNSEGDCVPVQHCQCTDGGHWNTCPPQKCKAEYCAKSRDDPSSCKSTKNCGIPRCTCGFNQKRDRNGKCINVRDCPPFLCGRNEVYNACSSICGDKCTDRNSTCEDPRYRIDTVIPCTPKCVCKKNYFRNSQGICVKSCQCDEDST